jgi:hypothetical protein
MVLATDARRLTSDAEVHEAAVWRLAAWTEQQIDAGMGELAQLLDAGHELAGDNPAVAAALQRLARPGDRRGSWSALCALAVFAAEARGDAGLFWRAGEQIVASRRQARRGHHRPAGDALDDLIAENVRRHPNRTARELFEHFRRLAGTALTCVVEADDHRLLIEPDPQSTRLLGISRHAFEVRVSRTRARVLGEQQRVGVSVTRGQELQAAIATWQSRSNLQTVTER